MASIMATILFWVGLICIIVAHVLLIVGLRLRKRRLWIAAPIIFVCACNLLFFSMMFKIQSSREPSPDEIIDEYHGDYFIERDQRYEALNIKATFEHQSRQHAKAVYQHIEGTTEYNFYTMPNAGRYDVLINDYGYLYCRAEQKESAIAYLMDEDNIVWYGQREDSNTKKLEMELVNEVLTFCESAEGTEEIPLEDCWDITLTKTSGGIIERESVSLLLYGGLVYYAPTEGAPIAVLPHDLSIRLLTALDG